MIMMATPLTIRRQPGFGRCDRRPRVDCFFGMSCAASWAAAKSLPCRRRRLLFVCVCVAEAVISQRTCAQG